MEEHALKASLSKSHAIRKWNSVNSVETSALDRATLAGRLAYDPIRQLDRLIGSDPARQFERHVREMERTQQLLGLKPPIEKLARLEGILGSEAVRQIDRHQEVMRLHRSAEIPYPVSNWDFTPKRDFHLEALADIRRSIRTAAQQQAENVQTGVVDLIRQQQEGLQEDQQLLVYCDTGCERIQVLEIVLPNHHMVILNGVDAEGNSASLIVTLNNLKIATKVMRVLPPDKAYRIGFRTEL